MVRFVSVLLLCYAFMLTGCTEEYDVFETDQISQKDLPEARMQARYWNDVFYSSEYQGGGYSDQYQVATDNYSLKYENMLKEEKQPYYMDMKVETVSAEFETVEAEKPCPCKQ